MRLLKYFVFILGASEALAQVGMFQPAWLAHTTSTLYPTQVAGLLIWLKPGKQTFSDGDPVGTVLDYSGNGNHFIADGLERPTFTNDNPLFGNNGTLWFDGITNTIYSSNQVNIPQYTMFMVGNMSYINFSKVFLLYTSASNSVMFNEFEFWMSGANNLSFYHSRAPEIVSFGINPGSDYWATNQPFTVMQQYNGHNDRTSMKTNGVYITKSELNIGEPGTNAFWSNPELFGAFTNSVYATKGIFAEFLLYTNILTTNQIESIEHYLKTQFSHY